MSNYIEQPQTADQEFVGDLMPEKSKRPPRALEPTASASLASKVLEKMNASSKKPMIPYTGVGYIVATQPKTNRAIAVVDGDFGRAEFKSVFTDARAAGLATDAIIVVANTATYVGSGINFCKFDDLGLSNTTIKKEVPETSPNLKTDLFHAKILAQLTKTDPGDWHRTASFAFDEKDFGQPFDRRHGNDVFAAYQLTHKNGQVAQIEYDSSDYIFVDCGEFHWSGPLEDEVVAQATHDTMIDDKEASTNNGDRYWLLAFGPNSSYAEATVIRAQEVNEAKERGIKIAMRELAQYPGTYLVEEIRGQPKNTGIYAMLLPEAKIMIDTHWESHDVICDHWESVIQDGSRNPVRERQSN